MHADGLLVHDAAAVLALYRHSHKVAQANIDAVIALELLVDAGEFEGIRLLARELARRLELAHERRKLIGVRPVLQHLD